MFIQKVRSTIEKYRMVQPGDLVVVGVSGGVDSVCLLHSLASLKGELQIGLVVAHLDHMFRPADAARELKLVEAHAAQLGLPFRVEQCDVPAMARLRGLSPQHAARIARYDFYGSICGEFSANKVAVGHTADDQAETVLLRLIQGSGSRGLAGVRPVRSGLVIRPLIEMSRSEIEEFARAKGLQFAEDPTNFKPVYLRNKVRLELLPQLKKSYGPSIVQRLCTLAEVVNAESEYIERHARALLDQIGSKGQGGEIAVDSKKFFEQHLAMQRCIIRLCHDETSSSGGGGLNFRHVQRVIELARGGQGTKSINLAGGVLAKREYGRLIFCRTSGQHKAHPPTIKLNVPGLTLAEPFGLAFTAGISREKNSYKGQDRALRAFLDNGKIKGDLILRSRIQGDRIKPLGMQGRKKVHDIFIDAKLPRSDRERTPLLLHQGDVVWVVGQTISDDYKIRESTAEILKIEAKRL